MDGILKFFYEMGQLKRVKRSGEWTAKVKEPYSVAEHIFRSAIVAYVLAKLEGADPEKTAMMALVHDIHEARVNDMHKLGQRYMDFRAAEDNAFDEQTKQLPTEITQSINGLRAEAKKDTSKEAIVARDAELIEDALQAKEYIDIGYRDFKDWLANIRKTVRTKSAVRLLDLIEKTDSNCWWQNLKKIER